MNNNNKQFDDNQKTSKGNGFRYNKGKLRYDLVEPHAFKDFVDVLTDGANKYFDRNWENGLSWTSVLASLKRHIQAFEMGEDYDPESGKLHIAHAACNIHFLNAYYYIFPQGDDRPKKFLKYPRIGIDVDGVIADFNSAWCNKYPDVNNDMNSWYIDYNMIKRFDEMRTNNTLDGFYLNIKPLISPDDLLFEPYCYITSRPVSKSITEMWLKKNKFPLKKVINVGVNGKKSQAALEEGVEIFIDDNFENFVELNNNGIFTFLKTQPWNIKYNVGHMRIDSIKDLPFFK